MSLLLDKSFAFAKIIVKTYEYLKHSRHETTLSKQLLRSGTSIGANIHEGHYGSSKKDFINKLQIALKECYETEYWIKLLMETGYLDVKEHSIVFEKCQEIRRLLMASCKTAKANETQN